MCARTVRPVSFGDARDHYQMACAEVKTDVSRAWALTMLGEVALWERQQRLWRDQE
jgi:hypothetical protein